jgi:hypothetical protein
MASCAAGASPMGRRKFIEAIKALPKKERKTLTAAHEAVRRIDELFNIERELSTLSDTNLAEKAILALRRYGQRRQGQRPALQPGTDRANELEPYTYLRRHRECVGVRVL